MIQQKKLSLWSLILIGLGLYRRVRVSGHSMSPLLNDGDEVLVNMKAYVESAPQMGDLVLSRHPLKRDLHIIKKVERMEPDGSLHLHGINHLESTDSRSFGAVGVRSILGRVVSIVVTKTS